MSTFYRLYLGLRDRNGEPVPFSVKAAFLRRVADLFQGFTTFSISGSWEGKREPSLILEIIAAPRDRETIGRLGTEYRDRANQSAVLMTESQVMSVLI